MKAYSGERKAWDKLKLMASEQDDKFANDAQSSYNMVKDYYSNPAFADPEILDVKWNVGVKDSSFTINDIMKFYYDAIHLNKDSYEKLQLIKYMWNRKDFAQKDKLRFLITVMNADNHLLVVRYAGILFTSFTKLSIKYLAIDYFNTWWEKNIDNY